MIVSCTLYGLVIYICLKANYNIGVLETIELELIIYEYENMYTGKIIPQVHKH